MYYLIAHIVLGVIAYAAFYAMEDHKNDIDDNTFMAFMCIMAGVFAFAIVASLLLGKYLKSELLDQQKK